jgi:Carboxypeptidase regulatory-like domain/TonB dependent receptor
VSVLSFLNPESCNPQKKTFYPVVNPASPVSILLQGEGTNMLNQSRTVVAAVLSLVICSAHLFAQMETATISGLVVDPTGASVPGARVDAINADTNVSLTTQTNKEGIYNFVNVRPGRYRLAVVKDGFRPINRLDVIVHVQDSVSQNFALEVGAASESITVTADQNNINTTNASVSTVVDRQFVENIPLNGRSFQTLIALAPGVVVTAASASEQGQFSVNGQRADANYFTVDGVSANIGVSAGVALTQEAGGALPGFSAQGGTNSLVSVDALQEFRIQTSSFAPEFGRTPGGQVSIQTRSGTNQFHGTLFDYFRNDVLDANDWFNNHNHLRKPADRQNDFGGVFGGPIFKDHTFFFFSYEGLRLRLPSNATAVVPNQATRQNAPAAIQPFLKAFPVPNGPDFGNGTAQFSASFSIPSTLDAYSIRLDHMVNSSVSLFGRYNYAPSEVALRPATSSASLNEIGDNISRVHTLTLGSNQILTPSINNEVRVNFSYVKNALTVTLDNLGGAVPLTDSIFPAGFTSADSKFQFSMTTAALLFGRNAANAQRQLNFVDNLSLTTGTHQIKIGADYRWLAPINGVGKYVQVLIFTGVNGPNGVLSGTPLLALVQAEQPTAYLVHDFSLYGQDTWKPMPRLTLTYGLRWEVNPALKGKTAVSDPFTVTGLSNPATMSLASRGTPLYETTYGNVAPRLGIAYQISAAKGRELVLRGGGGTFYDLGTGSVALFSAGFPFIAQKIFFGAPYPFTPQQAAPPPFSTAPPVSALIVADPNLALPRTYEWNAAVEQALGKNQSLSLTYVGSAGRQLLRQDTLCFTAACGVSNPSFTNTVQVFRDTATSDYNALQIQFRRNLAHGLQALASYTWSHSLDIASSDSAAITGTSAIAGNPNIDRGNSDFDIRHTFNMALTYDIPAPRGARWAHAVLGDWSIDSLLTARSAPPLNVAGLTVFIGGTRFSGRPNLVPGVPVYLTGPQFPGGVALNPAALVNNPAGQQGNLARNQLRLFGEWQENFALRRQFKLHENVALQFRAEFFNIFNHPNFGNPTFQNLTVGSPLFGQSTQTLATSLGTGGQQGGFSPLYQIGGPRSTQLALKLTF